MPLPNPSNGEPKNEFMERCLTQLESEGYDLSDDAERAQAVAICETQYDKEDTKKGILGDISNKAKNRELMEQRHKDNIDAFNSLIESVENTTKAVREIQIPDSVHVTNQVKEVKVSNFPEPQKSIELKKPSWYEKFNATPIIKQIGDGIDALIEFANRKRFNVNLDDYKKKDNALAVNVVKGGNNTYVSPSSEVSFEDKAGRGIRAKVDEFGHAQVDITGHVSDINSTSTPLLAGQTFTGEAEETLNHGTIFVSIYSDVASAINGLVVEQSTDGVTWGRFDDSFTISAGTGKNFSINPHAKYFRVTYTNGSSDQTIMDLQTVMKGNSKPSSHKIQDNITTEDDAELVTATIKAEREGTPGKFYNVGADVSGNLNTVIGGISQDAGGRVRVSQLTTLGDYKILNEDRSLLIENAGTGTGTFTNNKFNMAVTSGQWYVRQSRRYHPYFSGKSQIYEVTFDNFGLQDGVVKRVGGFSSNAASPYDSTYDGVWLENDGTKYIMKAARAGVETVSVDWTDWDNYDLIENHDWDAFNVIFIDYLWLGGAIYRLWMKNGGGFVLLHTVHYPGTSQDVFIKSPNQPVRYEIRSSTGSGSFRFICAQCSTEGSVDESGIGRTYSGSAVTISSIGTTYPLLALRKKTTHRDISVELEDLSAFPTSTNDIMRWSIHVNPTLSVGLTYANLSNSALQAASGNGTITVVSAGTVIAAGTTSTNGQLPANVLKRNFLSSLGSTLNNTMDEYVLCGTPVTSNITVYPTLSYKEV